MWKLSEITIRNIVSFREASFVFPQRVATLIFGKNEDNAAQPCNGSGKSSFIEAISLALTGEQLRKVKSIEEIINDSQEEAYVYVKLENTFNNTIFTIERTLSRSNPQVIECHKYDEAGREIETEKTTQPTVSDYNKFILSEIGLSKDDIYNNFILCDNKYESFFDCSDRNKKEIINRFSNGVIIDESIARLQADMEPVKEELTAFTNKAIEIKGSVSAIQNELAHIDEKRAFAKEERQLRIAKIEKEIVECRNTIDSHEAQQKKAEDRLALLKGLQKTMVDMEDSDMSLLDAYGKIKQMCIDNSLKSVSEFDVLSERYKNRLTEKHRLIDGLQVQLNNEKMRIEEYKSEYNKHLESYQGHLKLDEQLRAEDVAKKDKIKQEISKIDDQLNKIEDTVQSNKKRIIELNAQIARENALLEGVVTCPKCQHKFFLNDDTPIEVVRKNITEKNLEIEKIKSENQNLCNQFDKLDGNAADKEADIKKIDIELKKRCQELENQYDDLKVLSKKVDCAESNMSNLQLQLTSARNELDVTNGKIEVLRNRLFGEISGILEGAVLNGSGYMEQQKSALAFYRGQMKQYQQAKKELSEAPETDFSSSLTASLKKYNKELKEAEREVALVQGKFDKLREQEVNFTMFKSYIARKKIDALSLIVNDFLEKIGSDIRLRLEGFTVTKTGKLRDKISVQVMRDGIDCGSYHKFSGGEKARLNLACILSLHTLTNSNCEDGKGLDFIIIDELLDKSDEMGMTTYCDALNKLGQTALLITQGSVSEGYPHKLLIVKKQGVSTIQN